MGMHAVISIYKPMPPAPRLSPRLHGDRLDVQQVGSFTVIINPAMPPEEIWVVGQGGKTIKQKVKTK